jgi:hypothetical protein
LLAFSLLWTTLERAEGAEEKEGEEDSFFEKTCGSAVPEEKENECDGFFLRGQ